MAHFFPISHPFAVCFCFLLMWSGCAEPERQENHRTVNQQHLLVADSLTLSRLSMDTVRSGPLTKRLTVNSVVRMIPTHYAEVVPPFAGRITKVHVAFGQQVQKGAPVLEVSSPDFYEAQTAYFHAKQDFEFAAQKQRRQEDLYNNGVGVEKELEEAKAEFQLKKTTLEHAVAAVKVFNADPAQMILGEHLLVRSPLTGTVIAQDLLQGQYFNPEDQSVITVADLSKVWVVGRAKEKDLGLLNDVQSVRIGIPALPNDTIEGVLHQVSPVIDEETRSAEVFIECRNAEALLKPGMYVNTELEGIQQEAIGLRATAIFQEGSKQFVYVKQEGNQFEKRVIETRGESRDGVQIVSGLNEGDIIVAQGGALLKSNHTRGGSDLRQE